MTNTNNSPWNDSNSNMVRLWWENEGFSAGKIAFELNKLGYNVSRNSVVGKVHRMKLVAPEWKARRYKEQSSQRLKISHSHQSKRVRGPKQEAILIMGKKFNSAKAPPIVVSLAHSPPDNKDWVLLKESGAGNCKYIVGYVSGKASEAVYCGKKTDVAANKYGERVHTPWCPYHRSICTTESKPAKSTMYRMGPRR